MIRAWVGGLVLAVVAAPVGAQGVDAGSRVFVEVGADRQRGFEQQAVAVVLRFGIEEEFLREQVIQPFRRTLDVPVRVDGPWFDELEGAARGPGDREDAGASFVLNGGLVRARRVDPRVVDGRAFVMFEVVRSFVPVKAGGLRLGPTRLEVEFATRFREDFLDGRVPVDRTVAEVVAEDVLLRVDALPVVGRPVEFTGAVGRFAVRSEIDRSEVEVGGALRLTLIIEGDGNFAAFGPPVLGEFDGFHVLGRIEERGAASRRVVWDLAPLGPAVRAVPGVAFAFFDPESPAGYRTVRSDAIPISVTGEAVEVGGASEVRAPLPGVDDIHPLKSPGAPSPSRGHLRGLPLWGGILAPWLGAVGVLSWRRLERRRRARAGDGARAAFVARADGGDVEGGLVGFLAAKLRCSEAAVVAPELAERLVAAGVSGERAARAGEVVRGFVASRHGGRANVGAERDARALVDELDGVLAAAEGSR